LRLGLVQRRDQMEHRGMPTIKEAESAAGQQFALSRSSAQWRIECQAKFPDRCRPGSRLSGCHTARSKGEKNGRCSDSSSLRPIGTSRLAQETKGGVYKCLALLSMHLVIGCQILATACPETPRRANEWLAGKPTNPLSHASGKF
jgi:hypothetical protein